MARNRKRGTPKPFQVGQGGRLPKQLTKVSEKAKQHALSRALVGQSKKYSTSKKQDQRKKLLPKTLAVKAREIDDSVAKSMRNLKPQLSIKKRQHKGPRRQEKDKKDSYISDMADFVNENRLKVGKYGASGLDKKTAKQYEAEELAKLGCRKPKPQKMPIWQLQNQRKNEKKKLEKQKELDRQNGKLVKSKRTRRK